MDNIELEVKNYAPDNKGFSFDSSFYGTLELPDKCPYCGRSIFPAHLITINVERIEDDEIASIYLCSSCGGYIFTLNHLSSYEAYALTDVFPTSINKEKFSESIAQVSQNFIDIYAQAATAENNGLDEICGMGYRKALEFLIKDYAIKNYPEKNEEISKCTLSQCINTYCDNDTIKKLAMASAWLGNDETHYVRKYENYSIVDLKAFIDVIISYIEQKVTINRAEELLANRKNKE